MNISELLRKLADVIASAEGDESGPQSADLSPVKVDHQDNTDTKTGVFVPPLQAKLELLKKSVNVDNVYDQGGADEELTGRGNDNEDDELQQVKRLSGIVSTDEASSDEPLDA